MLIHKNINAGTWVSWRRRCGRRLGAGVPLARAAPPAAPTASHGATAAANDDATEQLREWVVRQGGTVHPALRVQDDAPSGCRGVVAVTEVAMEALEAGALISLPADLRLPHRHAQDLLAAQASGAGSSSSTAAASAAAASAAAALPALSPGEADQLQALLESFSVTQQLAMSVALERKLGARSFWSPYIATLPNSPPVPWLLPDAQLHAALAALPFPTVGWAQAVREAGEQYAEDARQLVDGFGPVVGLSHDEALWAIGHVCSRCLTSSSTSYLIPFIDLINHSHSARPPMRQLDNNDHIVITVTSIRDGKAAPLRPGDELFIQYGGEFTALEAFIKFGFVPRELWPPEAALVS